MEEYKFKVIPYDTEAAGGIVYPKKILEDTLKELQTRIESKMLFVTLDAYKIIQGLKPDYTTVDLSKVCGYITSWDMKEGFLYVSIKLLKKSLDNPKWAPNMADDLLVNNKDCLKIIPIGIGNIDANKNVSNYLISCFNLVLVK